MRKRRSGHVTEISRSEANWMVAWVLAYGFSELFEAGVGVAGHAGEDGGP